ncbi:MAG: alpha/beta hydrolase family protein [Candidatus Odinarchaeota archaeon]
MNDRTKEGKKSMTSNLDKILPVGYHELHPNEDFNYQLNRGISLGFARVEDFRNVARKITTLHEWIDEMVLLAERAKSENRLLNAAYYYRLAEFFTLSSDPNKVSLYRKFNEQFHQAFRNHQIKDYNVPYEEGFLPAYRFESHKSETKGTIIVHGGFDSFIEEFFNMGLVLADAGYEVIMFDGPGQGKALMEYQLKLIPEWEKPVSKILDFFSLDDAILIGISLGGYLGLRASAYDQRISKVIALGAVYDFYSARMSTLPPVSGMIIKTILKFRAGRIFNSIIQKAMEDDPDIEWSYRQSMFVFGLTTPYEVVERMKQFNLIKTSKLIKQDVLLLHGEGDNLIPVKMYYKQKKALTSARSISGRVFTSEDQATHHCQFGNVKLALDTILDWLNRK